MAVSSVRRTIVINLGEVIPPSALRVLIVPPVPPDILEALPKHEGARATIAAPDSEEAAAAAPFDCIFFYDGGGAADAAARYSNLLAPYGLIVLPVAMGEDGRPVEDARAQEALAAAGLCTYLAYENLLAPEAGYRLVSRGRVFRRIVAWVKKDYDPFQHAARLREEGRPDWAFAVLKLAPLGGISEPARLAVATLVKQGYLEEQFETAATARRIELLWNAHEEAYYAPAAALPFLGEVYARQAAMWDKLGAHAHARKLLRDIKAAGAEFSEPSLTGIAAPRALAPEHTLPADWQAPQEGPRVLMVTPLFPNYGLDVLYDGLCDVLGDDHVDEYPYKPWLHGATPDIAQNYPCTANRPGTLLDNRTLVTRLYEGYYDYVLIPDVETSAQFLHPKLVQLVLQAARNTPVFVVDQADDFADHREYVRRELDFSNVRGYFKRELIAGVDYGEGIYPLPFAYQAWRTPRLDDAPRRQDVFWAGARNAFREVYIGEIERRLGRAFDRKFTQAEYQSALLDSRIGISLAGAGFDTVRYWELPAHGCMLLSERLPTVIPHNFQDGVSAVFADDARDMAEKASHYISHPDQAAAIAKAGREHFLTYHTAEARAKQLLALIQDVSR